MTNRDERNGNAGTGTNTAPDEMAAWLHSHRPRPPRSWVLSVPLHTCAMRRWDGVRGGRTHRPNDASAYLNMKEVTKNGSLESDDPFKVRHPRSGAFLLRVYTDFDTRFVADVSGAAPVGRGGPRERSRSGGRHAWIRLILSRLGLVVQTAIRPGRRGSARFWASACAAGIRKSHVVFGPVRTFGPLTRFNGAAILRAAKWR
jgi:hypothetical protein